MTEKAPTLCEIEKLVRDSNTLIYSKALKLIEQDARSLLRKHKNLDEFVMAMGSWFFTPKDKSRDNFGNESFQSLPRYMQSFAKMMESFEVMELKITGAPMRFTADGPLVHDWGATDGKTVAETYGISRLRTEQH